MLEIDTSFLIKIPDFEEFEHASINHDNHNVDANGLFDNFFGENKLFFDETFDETDEISDELTINLELPLNTFPIYENLVLFPWESTNVKNIDFVIIPRYPAGSTDLFIYNIKVSLHDYGKIKTKYILETSINPASEITAPISFNCEIKFEVTNLFEKQLVTKETNTLNINYIFTTPTPTPTPTPTLTAAFFECKVFPQLYNFNDNLGTPVDINASITTRYLKYGINLLGSLGSGGASYPGLLYDPTGLFNFGLDDYITPGAPWEFFSLKISSGQSYIFNNAYAYTALKSSEINIYQVSSNHVVSKIVYPQISILIQYYTGLNEKVIHIRHLIKNNSNDIVNIKAARGMDPDVDVIQYGTFNTFNKRIFPQIPTTDIVYALGLISKKPIILYTDGNGFLHNTIIDGDWSLDPDDILKSNNILDYNISDSVISCAWDLGLFEPLEEKVVNCCYILDENLTNE